MALTVSQKANIAHAVDRMVKTQAVELPFDAQIIDELALVAASSGFAPSSGTFVQWARDNPISTLLRWLIFVG